MMGEKWRSWRYLAPSVGGGSRWRGRGSVDGGESRGVEVGAGIEELAGAVENGGGLRVWAQSSGDGSDRVQDGGVIAVELARDLGQGKRGQLAREVDGELPRPGNSGGPHGR